MKKDGSKVETRHRNLVEPGAKGKLGGADDDDAKAVKQNWIKMSPVRLLEILGRIPDL